MNKNDEELIDEYVAAFEKLDDCTIWWADPITWVFGTGDRDDDGYERWRPLRFSTDGTDLDQLYEALPARLPPLYERLILSYRWAEVDLEDYTLLANPFEPGLRALLQQMQKDKALWESLVPNGYLQFGKGSGGDYDPVCFDFRHRQSDGDCRVVKIDHEGLLCYQSVREVAELARSFRELLLKTIDRARRTKGGLA
jgi:hypothetical protein